MSCMEGVYRVDKTNRGFVTNVQTTSTAETMVKSYYVRCLAAYIQRSQSIVCSGTYL